MRNVIVRMPVFRRPDGPYRTGRGDINAAVHAPDVDDLLRGLKIMFQMLVDEEWEKLNSTA
jgi:hypothetical protein